MTKFNKEKIMRPKTVVHCETEEQANALLKWAASEGLKWCDGESYIERINWGEYREKTCYDLLSGEFSPIKFYLGKGYTIIPYKEAMMLKKGDRVYVSDKSEEKALEDKTIHVYLADVGGITPHVVVEEKEYKSGNYRAYTWGYAVKVPEKRTITLDDLFEKAGLSRDEWEVETNEKGVKKS